MRVSLNLDGELSQVEHAMVRAHTRSCDACAEFAHELGAMTRRIRKTPDERPVRIGVPAHRRRAGTRSLQVCAAAVAVVAAVALGSLTGSLGSGRQAQGVKSARAVRQTPPGDVLSRFVAQLATSSKARRPV